MNDSTTNSYLEDLKNFKNYYMEIRPQCQKPIVSDPGLEYCAERISDLLTLRWEAVPDNFSQDRWQ